VEQECNLFMKKVFEGAKSEYQSKIIPIPVFTPVKGDISNFIGRVGKQLLIHTNVSSTLYVHKMSAWYTKDEKEVVGIKIFDLLIDSMGVFGVTGLNRYYGFGLVKELQIFINKTRKMKEDIKFKNLLEGFVKATSVTSSLIPSVKWYHDILSKVGEMDALHKAVAEIGQKQLLRKHLANILGFKCKLDSNSLYCSLETLNKGLINEVQAHYRNPEKPYPSGPDSILYESAKYMENVGLNDPLSKIYITVNIIFDFSAFLFMLVMRLVFKFSFDAFLGTKPAKLKNYDDTTFVVGIITILKQFHSSVTTEFFGYIGQYIRSTLAEYLEQPTKNIPPDAQKMLMFVDILARFGNFPQSLLTECIPHYIRTEYPKVLIIPK